LKRFCSETTAIVAKADSQSPSKSSDGEMHYHGVYSLLTPSSILKPSRYTSKSSITETSSHEPPTSIVDCNSEIVTQTELDELHQQLSAPLSHTFNFPRSYTENTARVPTTSISIEEGEEKKESDNTFTRNSSRDIFLLTKKESFEETSSTSGTTGSSGDDNIEKDSSDNNYPLQDKLESSQGLHNQHLRFDPRVTVTEFEDPAPRDWYQEKELDTHKREAIVLAQSYLRKHPAMAGWYRRAILDPVTKTYRKRALFSLPVFSSTYSSSDADSNSDPPKSEEGQPNPSHNQSSALSPSLQQDEQHSIPSVKNILIVHPNPAIASLFCKSMKSMFPSAKLVSSGSSEEALRHIECSYAGKDGLSNETSTFDIMIIEQRLNQSTNTKAKTFTKFLQNLTKGPWGCLELLTKNNEDESIEGAVISSPSCGCFYGSELIHKVCELSLHKQQQCCSIVSSCLIIGVSVRPERDASVMKQAGADLVWGIPIPSVGDNLRNKIYTKLRAKRSLVPAKPIDDNC